MRKLSCEKAVRLLACASTVAGYYGPIPPVKRDELVQALGVTPEEIDAWWNNQMSIEWDGASKH